MDSGSIGARFEIQCRFVIDPGTDSRVNSVKKNNHQNVKLCRLILTIKTLFGVNWSSIQNSVSIRDRSGD